ncbi:MAG TPA: 3-hydroxyacyl-CoA dehydrogenase family protein [Bacteroidales bacterium]|nr:3-hydroxyacyl-CoA dehydrogenase family protein [Bacteroidales bacterium]
MQKIGIVGEGKMGAGLFQLVSESGFSLVWLCSLEADTEKLGSQFARRLKRALEAGILTPGQVEKRAATVITSDPQALHDCDLVIEAIPEELGLKRDLFRQLDGIVQSGCIFASNSSSINPSEMAPASPRARRFAGIHFFYPVAMKNIAEVILSKETDAEALQRIEKFLEAVGRKYIVLDEENGFLLNKLFLDVQNEAWHVVDQGRCTEAEMDAIVREHLFPHGIFDFCDSVGLDTMLASVDHYISRYPHRAHFSGFRDRLAGLVATGKLGRKSGEGFFRYPDCGEPCPLPANSGEIAGYLRQIYLSSSKRLTALARLPIEDANHAIREYFGLERGPYEM